MGISLYYMTLVAKQIMKSLKINHCHRAQFLLLLLSFLFTGCFKHDSSEKLNDAFSQRLYDISVLSRDIIETTKSDHDFLDVEKINSIMKEASEIMVEFDISRSVQMSGFYSSLSLPSTKASGETKDAFSIVFPESTDYFQQIINNFLQNDAFVEIENVIHDKQLLDNEKVALAYMISFMQNDGNNLVKASESECRDAYNGSMKECRKWMYIGLGLSVASAAVSGFLSAAFAAATTIDYDHCSSAANDAYHDCLSQ